MKHLLLATVAPLAAARDIQDVSLEELLAMPIAVTARAERTLRESPGIVTVITREQIVRSGARDLLDVLALVPGFAAGVDVEGVVGLGVRGNWAHEGKVLLLLDGLELNETLYSTIQLGRAVPLAEVARVEIIRGPGSVVHGGYAELAVIHVITRRAEELRGASLSTSYGRMGAARGHESVSVAAGDVLPGGLHLSLAGRLSGAQRSDRAYRPIVGEGYSLDGQSDLRSRMLNVGAEFRGLQLRAVYDDHTVQERDAFDEPLARAVDTRFRSYLGEARYRLRVTDALTVTPRLSYKHQRPWWTTDPAANPGPYYDKTAERLGGALGADWRATPALHLSLGVQGYRDHARVHGDVVAGSQAPFPGGRRTVDYHAVAAFAEALWDTPLANLAVGARHEWHDEVGGAFVPRLAVTRGFGAFHAKALYAWAFRAPGIENIHLAPPDAPIRPERTTTAEVEGGWQLGPRTLLLVNAFDVTIRDPIVYYYDDVADLEGYRNFSRTGSRGVEVEYRLTGDRLWLDASYSFATAAGKNRVADYAVPGRDDVLLAFPAHKGALSASLALWRRLRLNPSATLVSRRFGYFPSAVPGEAVVDSLPPTLLMNLFLTADDLGVRGLHAAAGVHNLGNADDRYLQPYAGNHAPLPAPSREWSVRLSYTAPF